MMSHLKKIKKLFQIVVYSNWLSDHDLMPKNTNS